MKTKNNTKSKINILINKGLNQYTDKDFIIIKNISTEKKSEELFQIPYDVKPVFVEKKVISEDEIYKYIQNLYVYKKQEYIKFLEINNDENYRVKDFSQWVYLADMGFLDDHGRIIEWLEYTVVK